MNAGSKLFGRFFPVFVILAAGAFLLAIAIPNFVRSGPNKMNNIINNLRQLDAAKQQWAYEHVTTNWEQVAKLTNQISEQDLYPYLHRSGDGASYIVPVGGEKYLANALNESPEAKLAYPIAGYSWPAGSIIRFSGIEKPNCYFEVVFPGGAKTNF
jgi:hypothetical protein